MIEHMGYRVVCGPLADDFALKSAAMQCVGILRDQGKKAECYRVERVNGKEQVTRLPYLTFKRQHQQPQGEATHG